MQVVGREGRVRPSVSDLLEAFRAAFALIIHWDAGLVEIVGLSLRVTGASLLLAIAVGLPLGGFVALFRFPGRRVVAV